MQITSEAVERLVEQLMRLPTVGRKTAQRLAAYILKMSREDVLALAEALVAVKEKVVHCSTCFNVTDHDPCPICASPRRDHGVICVVEDTTDVLAIERTHEYRGVYHVLGGVLSPLDGVGPDDLRIRELLERVRRSGETPVREVILALNPTVEGDATTYYLAQLLEPFGVTVSRIARGLPVGSSLEYADEATLGRALEGRERL